MRVEVRGKVYESVPEAAKKLKVAKDTIYSALKRDRMDTVGLRQHGPICPKGGRPKVKITIGGCSWPSMADCARDLGVDPRYVRTVMHRGKAVAKERLKQRVYRWAMEQSAKGGKV